MNPPYQSYYNNKISIHQRHQLNNRLRSTYLYCLFKIKLYFVHVTNCFHRLEFCQSDCQLCQIEMGKLFVQNGKCTNGKCSKIQLHIFLSECTFARY
ncbi:unnamed protein product [Chrysodeixis includens]|uniref:Uncharacterized protein n=1 Tax=Chrysodeixis includens TaxID=689277 RepID=A0A9N8KU44_CHRIL|nr:unnamed protein product [Chrysodeixis includens]